MGMLPISVTNPRLSPFCLGLLKYRVMLKACPLLTVSSVLAYLSVWWLAAFTDGCQLMCVGVRSIKHKRSHEEATGMRSFAVQWRDEVTKSNYLLWEEVQLKSRWTIKSSLLVNNRNISLGFVKEPSYRVLTYFLYSAGCCFTTGLKKKFTGENWCYFIISAK